ncbi:CRTAC1 family protein [Candidatus Poribacteria bacterium]|nr:CRTAC1 family protein [Candidatus Poribacteria bacterium]MBT7806053.1 CRTAC1 family protein [Candidatus Poribacteria bacterium]
MAWLLIGPPATSHALFVDVAAQAGIDFRHFTGATGERYLPETMGAGCAFVDYDGDGALDILFANGREWPDAPSEHTPGLYRNIGAGRFVDATRAAGLDRSMYGMGLAIADIDNDGDRDIYFANLGRDLLFANRGDGTFEDITTDSGIENDGWSTSATFFDYDLDGLLDLFVCGYVEWTPDTDLDCGVSPSQPSYCTPTVYPGYPSRLYRNVGSGAFEDVTVAAGVYRAEGKSLGAVILDYDDDGWPDLAVANDTEPDLLFRNDGDGAFTEEGVVMGVAFGENGKARAGMGIDATSFGAEGSVAIAVGNFSAEMTGLFTGSAAAYFRDDARAAGIGASSLTRLTFGLFFFDYDLDGWTDLFCANGHIEPRVGDYQQATTYAQDATLFRGRADGRYHDVSSAAGLTTPGVGRGAAYGDYDGDGDLDVLVANNGVEDGRGAPWLLRNDGVSGAWLRVSTRGTRSNRDGIGAVVTVTAGGVTRRQMVKTGGSYCSQSETTLTFGLGDVESVHTLDVRWPSGVVDRYAGVQGRQTFTVTEGETQ